MIPSLSDLFWCDSHCFFPLVASPSNLGGAGPYPLPVSFETLLWMSSNIAFWHWMGLMWTKWVWVVILVLSDTCCGCGSSNQAVAQSQIVGQDGSHQMAWNTLLSTWSLMSAGVGTSQSQGGWFSNHSSCFRHSSCSVSSEMPNRHFSPPFSSFQLLFIAIRVAFERVEMAVGHTRGPSIEEEQGEDGSRGRELGNCSTSQSPPSPIGVHWSLLKSFGSSGLFTLQLLILIPFLVCN